MAGRATDIVELESFYIAGEGDDVLCHKAIEIGDRLQLEIAIARARMDFTHLERLQNELEDLDSVLRKIAGRSDSHDVLAVYNADARKKGRIP